VSYFPAAAENYPGWYVPASMRNAMMWFDAVMKIKFDEGEVAFDDQNPIDLSIPLIFNGPQPNAYGVEHAASTPCKAGDLVGDTRLGGSCNFEQYTFIPHCNGTHTECVGHITNERTSVRDCLRDVFVRASLVTISPRRAPRVTEGYSVAFGEWDTVITREDLEQVLAGRSPTALIIRTSPNDDSKLTRSYLDTIPPYFTDEAIGYVTELGVNHLLVDLPSIDRIFDQGNLANHRRFLGVEPGSFEINAGTRINSTITELIYVPNEAEDGEYVLNLQIAPFAADASPSRPVIFKIR
jgi:kynurenine formamidase